MSNYMLIYDGNNIVVDPAIGIVVTNIAYLSMIQCPSTSCGVAQLVAGVKTVNTTAILANDLVMLTFNTVGGLIGSLEARSADIIPGSSFKITSSSILDVSSVNWWILRRGQ